MRSTRCGSTLRLAVSRVEASPLARANDQRPAVTERFELYIAGREVANGFSELNDPEDQAARFGEQAQSEEHRVEGGRVVPLRRKKDVATLGPGLQVANLVQEEPAHHVERGEAGADVSRPGARNHVERVGHCFAMPDNESIVP